MAIAFSAVMVVVTLSGLAFALYGTWLVFKLVYMISLVSVAQLRTRLISKRPSQEIEVTWWDMAIAGVAASSFIAWRMWALSSVDPDDF